MPDELTIDERLQFLLQSTESLHSSLEHLHTIVTTEHQQERERWAHERNKWERLNRAIRAAVLEYFDDEEAN